MESDQEATDSTGLEIEDQINISLLTERKRHRKKRFGGENSSLKSREMCGRNRAIYGSVTGLLLLVVVLLAAFARASSSYETVNKKSEKRSSYSFRDTKDKWQLEQQAGDQALRDDQSLRLPRNLLPIEYLVYLHPNLTTFKFFGKVDILLFCKEDTESIVLHIGNEVTVKKVEVAELLGKNEARKLKVQDINRKQEVDMLSITLDETLIAGKYYFLLIEFNSTLSKGLSGFYLSSYVTKSGEKRYLATTHFEPTDARKAFPCFDEPDLKANFTIVIVREKHHVALANMPVERTDKCGSSDDFCIDHFMQSVKMSTYLVAFVVCDYHNIGKITKRGTKVKVWAPPEQIDQGKFALDVAVEVLSYYEEKFNVPYPLPKQDLIAIPDFAAGAMENWGLITYRLTSLLYDESESSDSNKQWVAVVVAHELAHQWFGNLVTMKWWNDLWLNEGFASFMENVGVNHVHPEWKMMDQFLLDKFQLAMDLDQLSSSHPIMAQVRDPAQINSLFDTISYDKGAAVIRMLEEVLGSDVFFNGLQRYLQKYKFRNAQTDDLWECIAQAAKDAGEEIDVKEMMDTWTGQMGFPVINILRSSSDPQTVTATQEHFLIHRGKKTESTSELLWLVPLTFISENNENKELFIMKKHDSKVTFQLPYGTESQEWIKMNAQQTGYYRVNYDTSNWKKLLNQLQTDHMKLSAADRAGLLDDSWKLARAGMVDNEIALDLTLYLRNEKDYVPWMSALSNMAYIATQFSTYDSVERGSKPAYPVYKRYMFELLKPLAKELGWEEKNDDPHLKRYLRASILKLTAEYDVEEETDVAAVARQWFLRWLKGEDEIPANLRNTVYSIGMKDADRETWDTVFEKFQHETVPSEKRKLMYALTSVRDLSILKELLEFSLDDSKIRSQDSVAVINSIAQNPSGRIAAWQFVKEKYNELFKRYGEGSFDFSRLIKATTSHFNTFDMYKDVVDFFNERDAGSGKRAVKQTKESIQANINWIKENMSEVLHWLNKQTTHHNTDDSRLHTDDSELAPGRR